MSEEGNKKENGSVFRVEKTKNYTVMSNFHLKDTRISLKAIGLLCKMLSLPENWDYSISGLVSICKESDTAVKSTLSELKEFGYLEINKLQGENGLFKYEYVVYEEPKRANSPEGGFPPLDKPTADNPTVDEPTMENHIQLNTNKLNTDLLNTQNQDNSSNVEETPLEIPNQVKEFFDNYNLIAIRLPKASKLSEKRKNKIKARLKDLDLEGWKKVFEKCNKSDFCAGINNGNWKANLDWLIENDNNYLKVLEGKYDNSKNNNTLRGNYNNPSKTLEQLQQEGMDLL